MRCSSCVARAEKALKSVPGVESVVVDLATKQATIQHHGTEEAKLVAAITRSPAEANEGRDHGRE